MAFSYSTVTGPLADFIVAELEGNKAQVIAAITQAEGSIENAIVAYIKAMPKPAGFLGIVFPQVEAALMKYATQLVAQYGPEVIFAFIDAEAHSFAKQLGG